MSILYEGENTMTKEKTDIRIIKKATCISLSGRSELTYEFGLRNKTVMFRITNNSEAGHFQDAWIPLDVIINTLEKAKSPFSLSVIKPLYSGQSINNTGFLGAVLKKEGLIVSKKRQYVKKDTKAFIADINKLIKPKRPASKTSKPKKEEPK
jgi:hypothetical protein